MTGRQAGFTTAELTLTLAGGAVLAAAAMAMAFAVINRDSAVSLKVLYIAGQAVEYETGVAAARMLRAEHAAGRPAPVFESIPGRGGRGAQGRACLWQTGCAFDDGDIALSDLTQDAWRNATPPAIPFDYCDDGNGPREAVYGVWVDAEDAAQAREIHARLEAAAARSEFAILAYGIDADPADPGGDGFGVLACF
ncbi:MAG: hypothetical protein F4Y00_07820 [Bacteroidetes bacterium SB0662_bin_6]|nr:hypothetical protein [Gammaproteobacteria bacterium]MYE04860.1 hypothetical protein [Bacteroidetes bacterium SB0662_bin_6]